MNSYKSNIVWCLVVAILAMSMPAAPAYAFSLSDLLGQTAVSNSPEFQSSSSGNSLINILIGLLSGKFLGSVLDSNNKSSDSPLNLDAKDGKEVVGFYAEWWGADTSSFNSMVKNANAISTISPFWTTLNGDASLTDRGGDDHNAVVKKAHENNISVLLLVNNEKQNESSPPIHNVLASSNLRTKAIDNLEATIKKYKLDGVNIDFEMVPAGDRENLTVFMRELSARLRPQGYVVSIDVFPKQDESNDVSIAYDYQELAKFADKIMIMTYDNHGAWSQAGPIADINWVENNLRYALRYIPKEKIHLGIAAYGYDWSSKGAESLEYPAVMNLVKKFGSSVIWDDASKSPHFSYTGPDGIVHNVWFENSESLKYKLDLVNKYDIAGIAVWKLGEEDPGYWKIIKDKLPIRR